MDKMEDTASCFCPHSFGRAVIVGRRGDPGPASLMTRTRTVPVTSRGLNRRSSRVTGSLSQLALFFSNLSFIATTDREESQVSPQAGAPLVGFELETNGFQFYAIANLDKTSLC